MTCVAVQYSDQGGGGAYDLSVVFDPYWPGLHPDLEDKVLATAQYSDGRLIVALGGADGNVYVTEQDAPGGKWVKSGPVGGPVGIAGAVTFSLEVANDAPGVFVASADPVASDNGEVWTTWKRADGSWAAWAQIA
jgi:hypothetical protein